MNRFFTLFAAAVCALGATAAETFFSADFTAYTADDFAAWKVVDGNDDGKTWTFDATGSPSHVFYNYHGSNQANDWLISPAITIPADGSYLLSYDFSGSSYGEAFEIWTGSAQTVEAMTEKIAEHKDVKGEKQGSLAFLDAKAGTIHIAFHGISDKDKFRLYLCSAKLTEAKNPVDLQVSEIISPVEGEGLGHETVSVKVNNLGRIAVESYDVAFSLNGGEPVVEHVTEPIAVGESKIYTFKAKADLSKGHFTHTIKAWTDHADDLNRANDAVEVKVRHIAPATVPYELGFEPDEDTSGMTYLNLNNDDGDWSINIGGGWFGNFQRTGYGCLAYNYNKDNNADDWAFLEPIEMEAGYYVLKYWYSSTEDHTERMRVCYGNAPTPEAMTNVLAEYDAITNPVYEEAIHIFELKNAGKVYIGFYCYSEKDENWLCVDDLSIEKVDAGWFDIKVSNLSSPTPFMRGGNLTDIKFTLQNAGIVNADVTVKVYLDGSLLKSSSYTVRGQEILPVSMEKALDGIAIGKHTLKIEASCEGDGEESNNVIETEVVVVDNAVAIWDFEDGQLPADITFRKENSAVNHPDSGSEFNADGFGIFNLEHYLLGKHALAVNTWFTESRSADNWIVLPQMTVTGEDAYFVWNANSYNPKFLESYEVKVSKGADSWSSYETVYKVSNESTSPQTQGISLSDYKGQNVYVALHVNTSNGEALILDNLGVYGEIKQASSGIEDVVGANACKVTVEGGVLRVYGAEARSISVFALDGSLVLSAEGDSVDLAGIASGLYIARVVTADGVVAVKFVF